MNALDNGGPAFPHSVRDRVGDETWPAATFDGMTLRDWFAGNAPNHRVDFPNPKMAAEFAGIDEPEEGDIEGLAKLSAAIQAKLAFIYADAMLAERSK